MSFGVASNGIQVARPDGSPGRSYSWCGRSAVALTDTPAWLLPAPSDVARALVNDRDILLPNALVTLEEVLIGFALALAPGVGLGIAVYRSEMLARVLYPLIIGSQTIPIPALAPSCSSGLATALDPKCSLRRWSGSSRSSSIRSKVCAPPIPTS